MNTHTDNTVDYVIVGAGSAGCVLADRLTADGRHRVLLEAGGRDASPWSHIPPGYGKVSPTRRSTDGVTQALSVMRRPARDSPPPPAGAMTDRVRNRGG